MLLDNKTKTEDSEFTKYSTSLKTTQKKADLT